MIEVSGWTLLLIVLVNFAAGVYWADQQHKREARRRREQRMRPAPGATIYRIPGDTPK
jgi:hypothetical protein